MFVRRKNNKTGTTSVQVIDKSHRSYRVIKSVGVGRSELEINRLEEKARQYILERQGMANGLFEDEDEIKLEAFLSSLSNSQLQVIGPELIFGTLYDRIGYGQIKNTMFRHLVITRLFSPGSKLKTIEYLLRYQSVSYDISKIYRFLDNLCHRKGEKKKAADDIKTRVEAISYARTKAVLGGKVDVVFYDMTTLYFEASDEDDLRKTGFSKDGKNQCPQIFLGLLVGYGGYPIGYEVFEGNIFEGNTFIPLLQRMERRYQLNRPVVIADSGLLSKKNIQTLEAEGYEYIIGARPKNESGSIKKQIEDSHLKYGDVIVINKQEKTRLIISMTEKRASKDAHNRERGLLRLKKRVAGGKLTKSSINSKGYNKYLKMEGDITISIDMEKYEQDAVWDGIKGYVTNTAHTAEEVIANYRNLWFIERAFRMSKTDLEVRPIYHRLHNRIEAHICICFTAYSILLEMERLLKMHHSSITLKRAQQITYNMYQLIYRLPNSKVVKNQILNMDDDQKELYEIVMKPEIL